MAADDRELVGDFLGSRSERAFRALYRAHTPYLLALALRLCGGRHDEAEDAVQEAWIRAAGRLDAFRWQSALRTWLGGIVINCCRELGRRRKTSLQGNVRDGATRAEDPARGVDLERLVAGLPEGLREVLVLHHIEGYTHQEIAHHLDIPPGTSKSRLSEACRRVRQALTEDSTRTGERS